MDILRYLASWTFVLAKNEKFVDAEKKKAKLFYAENETLNKKISRLFQKKQSAFLLQKFQKEGKKCSLSWAYTKDGLWVQSNLQNADISGIYGNKSGVRLESYLYDKQ